MTRKTKSRRIDRLQAAKYLETGRVFLESAKALSIVADEQANYGNAIGLLSIHAAISFTDALSIAYGECKSTDEHIAAIDTLQSILGNRLPPDMAKRLRKLLLEKDVVSYQGQFYDLDEGRQLLLLTEAYCKWAWDLFQLRP
jgi:hypothetical protein